MPPDSVKPQVHIPGAVLPTVMVVSTLLALLVLAVISLWEADSLYFSRRRHEVIVRAHIESGFTLYAEHPDEVLSRLDADSTLLLYNSISDSRIGISRRPLGLYEVVTISGSGGGTRVSKILGQRPPLSDTAATLYYPDRGHSISLAGKTNLKGPICIPAAGLIYGQIGADFFSGEEITLAMMSTSEDKLPPPSEEALSLIEEFLEFATEDAVIDGLQHLSDTVIVARKARIKSGFSGSLQVFATDSIVVEQNVSLDYPSGIFSEKHVSIGDGSEVNGYVIVHPTGGGSEPDIMQANYKQSCLAKVRGLVWVDGIAQIQGIVSGTAMIDRSIYYSPQGYYENMFYDVTILENREMAWPLWLEDAEDAEPKRLEIKWLD